MNERQRIRARRQYLSLGLGELVAAAVFAVCAAVAVAPRMASSTAIAALWSALLPLLLVLVLAVWAFGVVEYLNYFAVRLAYPASEWLAKVRQQRLPRLVKDLRLAAH